MSTEEQKKEKEVVEGGGPSEAPRREDEQVPTKAEETPSMTQTAFSIQSLWSRVKTEASKQIETIEKVSRELSQEVTELGKELNEEVKKEFKKGGGGDEGGKAREIVVFSPDGVPVVLEDKVDKGKGRATEGPSLDETIKERSQQVDELFSKWVTGAKKGLSKETTQGYLTKGESWLKTNLNVDLESVRKELETVSRDVFKVVPGESVGSSVSASANGTGGETTPPHRGTLLSRKERKLADLARDTAFLGQTTPSPLSDDALAFFNQPTPLDALQSYLDTDATLQTTYAALVPSVVPAETFASHYLSQVFSIEQEDAKRRELLKRVSSSTSLGTGSATPERHSSDTAALAPQEEDIAWDESDSDDKADSADTSKLSHETETYDVVNAKSADPSESTSSEDSDWE